MKMVKHKYVVGMIEVLASKTKIFIVLELVTGGELFDKIVSVGKLSEEQALFYFSQLVEGVEYCHKLGVCHRDLKPENLLLDEHGNLKISDFGLSSLYVGDAESDGTSRTELLHTTCGTPNYVAPEVLADQGYDGKKADVWSIGVILYVLLAGFLPFDESTIVALFAKIQKAEFTYPSWFSPAVRGLLDKMLVADPKVRVSLTKVKEDPWMQSGMSTARRVEAAAVHEPTAAQVEAAVQPLSHPTPVTSPSAPLKPSADPGVNMFDDLDDDDDDEDELGSKSSRGPRALNAFDLVSQCGGFLLDRMFRPQILGDLAGATIGGGDVATSSSVAAGAGSPGTKGEPLSGGFSGFSGSFIFGNAYRSRSTHFTSRLPAVDLVRVIYDALKVLECNANASVERCCGAGKMRVTRLTTKGMVGLSVQVFELCASLSLVTFKRGKGDLLEWNSLYNSLLDSLGTQINRPEKR